MTHESLKHTLRGVAFTLPTHFSEDAETVLGGKVEQIVTGIEDAGGELFLPWKHLSLTHKLSQDFSGTGSASTTEILSIYSFNTSLEQL